MPGDGESLGALAAALRSGERRPADLLAAIEIAVDRDEPAIRALVEEPDRVARLRRELAAVERRWPDPAARPPLFAVPVGVKDIFHAAGLPTGAGSRLPPEELAGDEGPAVARLKAAGAVVLAKTVSTEFAYFGPGPTRNPRDTRRTPGGSSSGSAAAVAAGFCPLALGTQTIGSICRPAAFCGVVGFKPSYDRIPRDGVIPLSPSLDHVGTFTSDVAGAALAASVMVEGWREAAPPARPVLGIPVGPLLDRAGDDALAAMRAAVARLEAAQYRVERIPAFAALEAIERRHRLIVAAEASRVHAGWYARWADRYHPRTVELIESGRRIGDAELGEALAGREALRAELAARAGQASVDLWICPAAPGPAPLGLESTGDPIMNLPWTHAGLPSLSLPCGRTDDGLPLGLQVVAGWRRDEELLAWARDIERIAEAR